MVLYHRNNAWQILRRICSALITGHGVFGKHRLVTANARVLLRKLALFAKARSVGQE